MTVAKKCFSLVLVLLLAFLQGCSTTNAPERRLAKGDLESIDQIRIVRYQFPGYMKDTAGSSAGALLAAAPFFLFGAIGGGLGGALYGHVKETGMLSAGKELETKYTLPDFTALVQKQFVEKLAGNGNGTPELIVEADPAKEDFVDSSSCSLTIKAVVIIEDGKGVLTRTEAQLTDKTRTVLWSKTVLYKTNSLSGPCTLGQLEEDNGKMLHGEIALAADKTVAELINHFSIRTETREYKETKTLTVY